MQFTGSVLSPVEAEIGIRQLKAIPIDEVGSSAWKDQREMLERLNMCAHSNAVQKTDDFVKSFLVEHGKLSVVLHELLVMEVWRQRVLPSCTSAIATTPTGAYMYCYYESVLVNLLECICFYEEVVTGFDDDVLELIDYCWRQVSRLFSEKDLTKAEWAGASAPSSGGDLGAASQEDAAAHLEHQLREQRISRAMACISILWFIVDRLDQLPLSGMNSILQKNDLPVGLSEALLLQPWVRRSATEVQKFQNGTFAPVKGDEVLRVCVPEAHCWFCLHKLLCDPECRRRYPYTAHKKEVLLRTRRFMNDALLDQIPALQDVQRALEELSFLEPPTGTEEKFKASLVIEQVPRLMSSIDAATHNWDSLGTRMQALLSDRGEATKDAMRMSQLFDLMFANAS